MVFKIWSHPDRPCRRLTELPKIHMVVLLAVVSAIQFFPKGHNNDVLYNRSEQSQFLWPCTRSRWQLYEAPADTLESWQGHFIVLVRIDDSIKLSKHKHTLCSHAICTDYRICLFDLPIGCQEEQKACSPLARHPRTIQLVCWLH